MHASLFSAWTRAQPFLHALLLHHAIHTMFFHYLRVHSVSCMSTRLLKPNIFRRRQPQFVSPTSVLVCQYFLSGVESIQEVRAQ